MPSLSLAATPATTRRRAGKPRVVYVVQWGTKAPSFERVSDAFELTDPRDAAKLAANACFIFGALSPAYGDEYWLIRETDTDARDWKSTTQFVRVRRTVK